MTNEQLELSLAGGQQLERPQRRERRRRRAAWWFGQMRQLVNSAIDWTAAPQPPPAQSWLELSHRRQSA